MKWWQGKRVREAFQAIAAHVGGRYEEEPGGFFTRATHRVVAVIDGQEVALGHYSVSTGKSRVTYTRLLATVPGSEGLRLRLGPEGVLATLGRAFGGQDIEIGEPEFDATFRVRGDDETFVISWLAATELARLIAASEYEYSLENGILTLHRRGLELEVAPAAAAMRAAAALCRGGLHLLEQWARVADALEARLISDASTFRPGRVRVEVGEGASQVFIESDAHTTIVRADLPRVSATRWNVRPGEELPTAAPASARAAWSSLQPASTSCDGASVRVTWPGYLLAPTRARRGVELVRALLPEPNLYR